MEAGALIPTRGNAFVPPPPPLSPGRSPTPPPAPSPDDTPPSAMTPQGMLVGLNGDVWASLQIAVSARGVLGFDAMGKAIQKAVQQN